MEMKTVFNDLNGVLHLSKREFFAALIMQGFSANDPNKGRMQCDYESHAKLAVQRADNLIAALKQSETSE